MSHEHQVCEFSENNAKILTLNERINRESRYFTTINKHILTIVNYYTNRLIFKNWLIFFMLKRCWYSGSDEKYNENLNILSTQLTAYHLHHK